MNVIIRPAKPEDAEACGRIIIELYQKLYEGSAPWR